MLHFAVCRCWGEGRKAQTGRHPSQKEQIGFDMSLQEGERQLAGSWVGGLALPKGLVAKKDPTRMAPGHSAIRKAGFARGEVSCLHELGLTSRVMEKVTKCLGLFVKSAVKSRNYAFSNLLLRWAEALDDMVIFSGCLRARFYPYEICKWPWDYRTQLAPGVTTQMQFLAPLKAGDYMEQLPSHWLITKVWALEMLKSRSVEESETTTWGSSGWVVAQLSGGRRQGGLANWAAHCADSCPVSQAIRGMDIPLAGVWQQLTVSMVVLVNSCFIQLSHCTRLVTAHDGS